MQKERHTQEGERTAERPIRDGRREGDGPRDTVRAETAGARERGGDGPRGAGDRGTDAGAQSPRGARGGGAPRRPDAWRGQGKERRLPTRGGWTGREASFPAAATSGLDRGAGTPRRLLSAPGQSRGPKPRPRQPRPR